jgi:hypothetical protein
MIEFLKKEGNSKLQETIAEYAFLKDLLVDGARNNVKILISRSDFDAFGYDILVQSEKSKRVVKLQLKATNGKTSIWDVHKSLIEDENGNVILIKVKTENDDLIFEYHIITGFRNEILPREPKKPHLNKCRLNIGDFSIVNKNEMVKKILDSPYF